MALTLNTEVVSQLASSEVWSVRLIVLTIGDTTYRLTDHYRDLVYDSNTYIANGDLISINNITNGIEVDNSSLEVTLSAVESVFRGDVLDADAIGGPVSIYRGLIDLDSGDLLADPIKVYEGIIFLSLIHI